MTLIFAGARLRCARVLDTFCKRLISRPFSLLLRDRVHANVSRFSAGAG
jgi:hypothetical protein